MVKKWWFPVAYMFVVSAFFSSIVIGFARFTDERVEANKDLAFEKAVLTVLPGLLQEGESRLQTHRKFVDRVGPPDEQSAGAYVLRDAGQIVAYALPMEGQGFWAPIKGVIGLKSDRRTITAIAFYEQNETPGLGAQITKVEFTSQFTGKVLSSEGKPIIFKQPGSPLGPNEVHAVTGATQTSTRLEKILDDALTRWYSKSVATGGSNPVK
ncbi:MAG: FMN-binding protein [Planctomycetota bacterium]|jgi:Na+-transporting NADH:ubiquinone oxidoreductase subunit C